MALMVWSMFNTMPCCTPLLLARPKPRISSLPNSFFLPAMAAILVVPMSRPTIMGCSLFMCLLFYLFVKDCGCTMLFILFFVFNFFLLLSCFFCLTSFCLIITFWRHHCFRNSVCFFFGHNRFFDNRLFYHLFFLFGRRFFTG